MPDTLEAPVIETAPPTEAPAAEGPKTGVASLLHELDNPKTVPDKKDAPAAKPDKVEKKAESKPELEKAEKPAEKAVTKPKGEAGIEEQRRGLERSKAEWSQKEQTYQTRLAEYEKQIKELKEKPERHPEDQKRIKELENSLAESDFRRSDTFKKEHTDKINSTYASVLDTVTKKFPVAVVTEDGSQTNRAATTKDFRAVYDADDADKGAIATKLFGVNANLVLNYASKLSDLVSNAEDVARQRGEQSESLARQRADTEKAQMKHFSERRALARKEVEDMLPEIYGEHAEDPDAGSALTKGREFIDTFRTNREGDKMTVEEIADHEAVIESRAAAYHFLKDRHISTAAKEQIESLKAELARYRKGDPGGGGDKGIPGEEKIGEDKPGISGLTSVFDKFR